MQKLKIRQYWSAHGRPWYVIRYGHKWSDYITSQDQELSLRIGEARDKAYFYILDNARAH